MSDHGLRSVRPRSLRLQASVGIALAGLLALATNPSEWLMGRENLAPVLEAQFEWFRQGAATFDTSRAEAWTEADLGFVVDQLTVTLKDGRSVQMRATIVLRKENGEWKMVHQHYSIGVPNDQVEAFQDFEEAVEKA